MPQRPFRRRRGRPPHPDVLTPAEWRVLEHLRAGLTNAEIASRLAVSRETVKTHVSNMLAKLELEDRVVLAQWTPHPGREPRRPLLGLGFAGLIWTSIKDHGRAIAFGIAATISVAVVAALLVALLGEDDSGDANPRTGESTRAVALPDPSPTFDAGGPSVLLHNYPDAGSGSNVGILRPINPATADDVPDYEPFEFRVRFSSAVSPDSRLLAVAGSWLQILDIGEWRETLRLDEPVGTISVLSWSSDSRRVFATKHQSSSSTDQLWVVDVVAGESSMLADLAFAVIGAPFLSPDGSRAYLFAYEPEDPRGGSYRVRGDPFLAVVGTESGDIVERIPLPGFLIGQRLDPIGNTENYVTYRPGVAMSPDGSKFYVAHPDADKVTVVDLETLRVENVVSVAKRPSIWTRVGSTLADLLVSTAEAKSGLSFSKQAVVSPDGRWLYVTGAEDVVCEGTSGFACEEGRPLGLQVIDTGTMRVVYEEEGISKIALSPGGRWIAATGRFSDFNNLTAFGNATDVGFGLKIIDATAPRLIAHLNPEVAYHDVVIAPDGRHVLVWSHSNGYNEALRREGRCALACGVISIIDVESLDVVAERPLLSLSPTLLSR